MTSALQPRDPCVAAATAAAADANPSVPWDIMACPFCLHSLERRDAAAWCPGCHTCYMRAEGGAFDLRLQRDKLSTFVVSLPAHGRPDARDVDTVVGPLELNQARVVDFADVPVPRHLNRELLSYFPQPSVPGARMLDIGCGTARHREVSEHAGFTYLGLDYDAPTASIFGDAHALPFEDDSFEFILLIAVLEHLRFPSVALREARRVLKPGGRLIGDVAFLEPFHSDSYYNHSHLGLWNELRDAGFSIERIAPSAGWSGLYALACTGLFPRLPRPLTRTLVAPLELLHRAWWWAGRRVRNVRARQDAVRVRNTTGSFAFIVGRDG